MVSVVRRKGKGSTDLLLPMFFMKIIASEVFHFPSELLETVMSMAPNVWRAASETRLLYSDEMFCALCVIWLSNVVARDEASL